MSDSKVCLSEYILVLIELVKPQDMARCNEQCMLSRYILGTNIWLVPLLSCNMLGSKCYVRGGDFN